MWPGRSTRSDDGFRQKLRMSIETSIFPSEHTARRMIFNRAGVANLGISAKLSKRRILSPKELPEESSVMSKLFAFCRTVAISIKFGTVFEWFLDHKYSKQFLKHKVICKKIIIFAVGYEKKRNRLKTDNEDASNKTSISVRAQEFFALVRDDVFYLSVHRVDAVFMEVYRRLGGQRP